MSAFVYVLSTRSKKFFLEGTMGTRLFPYEVFPNISLFPEILNLKTFSNSSGNIKLFILDIKLSFTFGE